MVDVNLAFENSDRERSAFGGGLPGVIAALVMTVLVYMGMILYNAKLVSDTTKIQERYKAQYSEILSGKAREILDFQNRMDMSASAMFGRSDIAGTFSGLEKIIISDVYVKQYSFDGASKSAKIICNAKNYNIVAKQILNFKSSGMFADVTVGETKFDLQNGSIEFIVNVKFK